MRFFFLFFIFLFSCSVKEKIFKNNNSQPDLNSNFIHVDSNSDGEISQQELNSFKESKKLTNPLVDYYNPFIIFLFILSLILSLCSITYIIDLFKKCFGLIKNLCNK